MLTKDKIIKKISTLDNGHSFIFFVIYEEKFVEAYKELSRFQGKCSNRKNAPLELKNKWATELTEKAYNFVKCCEVKFV